jgi:hypothetical protein
VKQEFCLENCSGENCWEMSENMTGNTLACLKQSVCVCVCVCVCLCVEWVQLAQVGVQWRIPPKLLMYFRVSIKPWYLCSNGAPVTTRSSHVKFAHCEQRSSPGTSSADFQTAQCELSNTNTLVRIPQSP